MPGSTHFHPANKFFQIKITTFTLILIIGLALVSAGSAMAGSSYTNAFNNRYGTSGSSGGLTLGSCITCHTSRSPGGSNKATNNYGRDFRNASHNFAAIESLDSDGDGYTNLTEILANAFPGDAASTPTPIRTASLRDLRDISVASWQIVLPIHMGWRGQKVPLSESCQTQE